MGIDFNKNVHWDVYIKQTPERKALARELLDLFYELQGWVGDNAPPTLIDRQFRQKATKWTSVDMRNEIERLKGIRDARAATKEKNDGK